MPPEEKIMSYLVMARKWRPKNFEEMVGQEHIAKTLRNALTSGRIAHAFLFTGTRGVGKTTSARILAKALNCKNGPTPTPCEVCENCLAVNQGASMDVLEIDGASNNGVDNVRDLREQVKYAPMHGQYKIYIIDEVHMLSKAAFNALLKTLEEPPPHVIFIFATTEVSKVPHTILSRVQRFDFRRISETAIRDRLDFICGQEKIQFEVEALEAIARKADGSMRDALSLFDRVVAFTGESLTLESTRKVLGIPEDRLFGNLLKCLMTHDTAGCFKALEEVYHQGLEISEFLSGFGEYLRDVLFSRQEGITPAMLGVGEARFRDLRALALDLQDGDLLRYAKITSDLLGGLKTAPHPRLWVELGLSRMAALDRVVTLSQLMGQESLPPVHIQPAPPVQLPTAAVPIPEPIPEAKKKSPEQPSSPTPSPTVVGEGEEETVLKPQFSSHPSPAFKAGEGLGVRDLPAQWTALVDSYSIEKPLTASPLRYSHLRIKPEETPVVEIVFSGSGHHDLFLADGEGKRSLRNFLAASLEADSIFTLAFAFEEPVGGTSKSAPVTEGLNVLLQREPIVKTLLDMFEGRVLEGPV